MNRYQKFIEKYQKLCDDFDLELYPVLECHNRLLKWIIKLFGKKAGLKIDLTIEKRDVE